MNAVPKVLHRTAKPISVHEFADAVQAVCRPRFPGARGSSAKPVGELATPNSIQRYR